MCPGYRASVLSPPGKISIFNKIPETHAGTLVLHISKDIFIHPGNRYLHTDKVLNCFQPIYKLLTSHCYSQTTFSSSRSSPNSMNIILKIFRNIIIDDKLKIINVQSPCSYISCHKKFYFTGLHSLYHLQSFFLRKIPHQKLYIEPVNPEPFCYLNNTDFCIGKN